MNDIAARFAAMTERARQQESEPAFPLRPPPASIRRETVRRPGEHRWAYLHRSAAEELAEYEYEDNVASIVPTPGVRGRAVAYVSLLLAAYVRLHKTPGAYKAGLVAKMEHLRRELALMQSTAPEGEVLARRWDFVVGDARGGQYGTMGPRP